MDVMETVLTRRSIPRLTGPAPDDATMLELVQAASTAPDHGRLTPWRLVMVHGSGRDRLAEALARDAPDPVAAERARAKPLRAPLLVSIVFCPRLPHAKVPEWEQLAATVSMVHTLQLLLHSRGWGAIWRTGPAVDSAAVRTCLGTGPGERLLGWLYVGTPDTSVTTAPRRPVDVRHKLSTLAGPAGQPVLLTGTPAAEGRT
ncbi:nitroreductase [Streptomyces mashuensis]|uniref:Putative NAD(P)H nitroreductase n=1 Tax=Streptomyces mashuensis TaxID=33904 RepID=A0A919B893_9ACTN|nr:nitroreductase [Streptomyces mashuensis]GHF65633.1 nitroreductase [Streptomyces mashuensis]